MPPSIPTNKITGNNVIPPGLPAGAAGGTTPFFFQQPPKIRKDDAGISTTVPYESSDFEQIYSLLPGLDFTEVAYDYQGGFGKARVDVTYAYDFLNSTPQTYVQPLWEFFAQKVDKDVSSADLPFGTIGAISPDDALLIQSAISIQQQQIPINSDWFTAPTDSTGSPLTNSAGTAVAAAVNPTGCYSLFLLMTRGLRDYPVFAPTLRFTQTVTSLYAIQASFTNVRRLLGRSTLITTENVPNALLFSIPNDPTPTQFIETAGDLQYAWFKDFPTVRQIARLKWNIVQEWQYGLWPVQVYGGVL